MIVIARYQLIAGFICFPRSINNYLFMRKKKSLKMDVYDFKVTITSNNINIKNSYKVTSRERMKVILNIIKEYVEDYDEGIETPFDHRSIKSMVREWVAHNNLYTLGYKKEQTKDIDLDYPQKWYISVIYWVLSLVKL